MGVPAPVRHLAAVTLNVDGWRRATHDWTHDIRGGRLGWRPGTRPRAMRGGALDLRQLRVGAPPAAAGAATRSRQMQRSRNFRSGPGSHSLPLRFRMAESAARCAGVAAPRPSRISRGRRVYGHAPTCTRPHSALHVLVRRAKGECTGTGSLSIVCVCSVATGADANLGTTLAEQRRVLQYLAAR